MKITSLDIRKQEFARTFRGYDVDEVDSFLQVVSTGWQEMVDELRRSGDKIQEQQLKLDHYMKVEEALEEALQTARTSARQTVESAEKKATTLLEDAENRVVDMQRDADTNRLEVKRQTARYAVRQQEIVAKLRSFLMSEMEMLHHYEAETGEHSLASSESRKEIELVKTDDDLGRVDVTQSTESTDVSALETSIESAEEKSAEENEVYFEADEAAVAVEEETATEEEVADSSEEMEEEVADEIEDPADDDTEVESPSWRVTPVFESVEEPEAETENEPTESTTREGDEDDRQNGEDFADEEIKKIHEILKGLDDEQDGDNR